MGLIYNPPLAASSIIGSGMAISQTISNTTSETTWNFPDTVIPASFWTPGSVVRVTQAGVYQSGLSQSITPRIRCGPAATGLTSRTVLVVTAGPVSGLLNAATDTPWAAETVHVMQADGSVLSYGVLFFSTSATAALNALVATKTPSGIINTAVDNVITGSAQWTNASTANQITCTTYSVELIKR